MKLQHTLLGAALAGLLLAGPAHAQDARNAREQARERLVEQIHNGETLQRDDLVDDAIQRLYRIDPDAPEGLVAQIYLATRRNQMDEAQQLLQRLERRAPGSAQLREGQALLRLASPESQAKLAQARLLSSVGRVEEARKVYDSIFQGVYPTADLAVEYWLLRSREPGSRATAIAALQTLLKTYPRHPRLLQSLADFAFSDGQPEQALAYLHRLAALPGQREAAANREFDYLVTLPVSAATVAAWRDFTQRYAGLPVQSRAVERLQAQQALVSDPIWRAGREAMARVDAGDAGNHLAPLQAAVRAYPNDAGFLGALGLAYLRQNNRSMALRYFERARDAEARIDQASRWVSLIASTQDWLLLEQADRAAQAGNWERARSLYSQVARKDPANVFAQIGLGDAALATGKPQAAWPYYRKAMALEPQNESAQNGVARYLATLTPAQALQTLATLPAVQQRYLVAVKRQLQIAHLEAQATEALQAGNRTLAISLLEQAQTLNPDDPWLSYRLAGLWLQNGDSARAFAAFERHLALHPDDPATRYAQALLNESVDDWQGALNALNAVQRPAWTPEMLALDERARSRERIARAQVLYDAGQPAAAIAALEQPPENTITRLQVAEWSNLMGDHARAMANYRAVLRAEPDNLDARLGELETWLAQGRLETVKATLQQNPPEPPPEAIGAWRRLANLWGAVGDTARARALLADTAARATAPEPLLYRDYARNVAPDQPQQSLNLYQKAMVDAGLLGATAPDTPRDDEAFTTAMQATPGDDWLQRSIRSDAASLYQRQNTTVTVSNDGWVRTDGTPGISRLNASTTQLQIEHPLMNGTAFLRADHIRLDAGTFDATPSGEIDERFGTCIFPGVDAQGNTQALAGCSSGLTQKANGTGFALGWQGDTFGFDIGRTPASFPISNWVGGVNVQGDLGELGWSLDVSRRPLSNSLLSLAGAVDPRTGIVWGGVLATGATLGLSWDRGEANGVWASLGHHRLTGTNVADNTRTRLMAGYYRRLINEPNRVMTIGVNGMYWRYDRDLGNYTLGQGGYYSPQRYASIGFPVTYAQRTGDWSFSLRGSVSRSVAKSNDESFYPLGGPIAGPLAELQGLGVTPAGFRAANISTGGTSGDWGYSLGAVVERRLSSHWVLGAGFDLQRGQDYTPSRFMLYLRYTVKPWRGSLPLGPTPPTPYADFN